MELYKVDAPKWILWSGRIKVNALKLTHQMELSEVDAPLSEFYEVDAPKWMH